MNINLEEIVSMYEQENNITKVARQYCNKHGYTYDDNIRRKFSNELKKYATSDNTETVKYATVLNINDESREVFSALDSEGKMMNIEKYCEFYGLDYSNVKYFKLVSHTGTPYYNIDFKRDFNSKNEFDDFSKKLLEELSEMKSAPRKEYVRQESKDNHLLVVDPCDIHIGKLCDAFEVGEEYNNQIAVSRVKEGVQGILDKASGFNIDKILFVGGNDILHIDTPKRTTTSGTPQDTDGMWYSNFLIAKTLYIEIIDQLLEVADVHFVFNPSNHDYFSAFFLADVIKTYYRDNSNITFDCSISHRKYFTYGDNLIGTTHGDGAKQSDLPLLMADEAEDWSKAKHRYIYGHHLHHKVAKDYIGVTFEVLRSPSGTDSWHHRNGYTGVPKAIEGFIHHSSFGQVARLTHIFQ